jgi:hypothetical protein
MTFREWRDQYTLSTIQADHETIVHAAFDAGYKAASVVVSLPYLAERHFCPRCGKRLMGPLGPVSLHTCCPPNARTFDDYGNKLP